MSKGLFRQLPYPVSKRIINIWRIKWRRTIFDTAEIGHVELDKYILQNSQPQQKQYKENTERKRRLTTLIFLEQAK
jgi:hypothetical protein